MQNQEVIHQFIEGMKGDFDNHAESNKSFVNGVNGRLYSENGVIAYSCIKGTKQVYSNPGIVKYLGSWAFADELIIFVKILPNGVPGGGHIEYETEYQLVADSFTVSAPYGEDVININLDTHVHLLTYDIPIFVPDVNLIDIDTVVSCLPDAPDGIDFSEYYSSSINAPNLTICPVSSGEQFDNNVDYIDCIISLKKDINTGNIYDTIIWSGLQNWPMDGKIVTQGVYENNFYKRVYYTDYYNVFRVVNIKDTKVAERTNKEFSTFQNVALLAPKIVSIDDNGQLKASTTVYTHKLYTSNGQQTEFSPISFPAKILVEDDDYKYAGGNVSELTGKSVTIKSNVLDWQNFSEIEAFAIEYEAFGSPTAIRSLGRKPSAPVVFFTHYGNEEEFISDTTISDIVERKNNWKYASDITANRNKLIAAGLRNDPLPLALQRITEDFALHGWNAAGDTHLCLINPEPWNYRYIDPTITSPLYYVKQRLYNSIQVFGNFTITLTNENTGEFLSTAIPGNNQNYADYIQAIWNWLDSIDNTADFLSFFPNLKVEYIQNKIFFTPINPAIQTDINNYNFSYSTNQVIEDYQNDIEFLDINPVFSRMVYGGVSLGFNQGNGIRMTFVTDTEEVLLSNPEAYADEDDARIMKLITPSGKRTHMDGEIYRYGLQCKDNDGYDLFTIPLGDLMVPALGEQKRYLSESGNPIIETAVYVNSSKTSAALYAHKVNVKVEVRLSCDIQKLIKTYQIVYVERTEENRTILCQGLSAPLERVNTFFHSEYISLLEPVNNKWNLPYYGGPSYDQHGLATYDNDPEINDNGYENSLNRVVTNRSLFYFDSPDVIFNLVSPERIKSGNVKRVLRVNTDHGNNIRQSNEAFVPNRFSRKLYETEIDFVPSNYEPHWINISVFANERTGMTDMIPISKAELVEAGSINAGSAFDTSHEVSNNAMTLGRQPWFYSQYARKSQKCSSEDGARSELFNSNNYSIGKHTVIIKTDDDVFTDDFIASNGFVVNGETNLGNSGSVTFDTHAVINIEMNNRVNVYGGRSELSYSQNIFSPLSDTIPTLVTSNGIQTFIMEGDSYSTLYIRNKNHMSKAEPGFKDMNNSGGCNNADEEEEWSRSGAWCYAVVLKCSVEPKWTYENTFWRQAGPALNFTTEVTETVNEAYLQTNNLRTYTARPYLFKDDPNMGNIIAASDPKLIGDYIDAWTNFRVNNFYEVDKDKGVVYNLAKFLDQIYAIQETQSSVLMIDERVYTQTTAGEVAIKQGDGSAISDHKVMSDFGTSIRRAVGEILSSSNDIKGFTFFDEKRIEFVRIDTALLLEKSLQLEVEKLFQNNPIIDSECYYDDHYKETVIRLRTKNGTAKTISFNEVLKAFNGYFDYDNDIYMVWNKNVYAPIRTISNQGDGPHPDSSKLHQLNVGNNLNLFGQLKTMKLGVVVNINPNGSKIFPHWAGVISVSYPVKKINLSTDLGQFREILGTHHKYRLREGIHSVPLKNRLDRDDLRGKYMTLEIEIESLENAEIRIFSFINFVRNSYL